MKEFFKEIENVFVPPKKKWYWGKIRYFCPYFLPTNYHETFLSIRKLERRTEMEIEKFKKENEYVSDKNTILYKNYPMVRRTKFWIFKDFYIKIGKPIKYAKLKLGWKKKWGTPRFEWFPFKSFYFFKWQICVLYVSPDNNNDLYYEMYLWWKYFSDKDLKKAKETWGWVDYSTKESTWNENYLINNS
jgi:hypothetical protein